MRGNHQTSGFTIPSLNVLTDIFQNHTDNPELSLQLNNIEVKRVNYRLNKNKAMMKKLEASNRSDPFIVTTVGNTCDIVIQFQAGLYEVIRKAIYIYYTHFRSHKYDSCITILQENSSNLIMQATYKIHLKGGGNSAYTINLYHTKSAMMVNGRAANTFSEEDWPNIQDIIRAYEAQSSISTHAEINSQIQKGIEALTTGMRQQAQQRKNLSDKTKKMVQSKPEAERERQSPINHNFTPSGTRNVRCIATDTTGTRMVLTPSRHDIPNGPKQQASVEDNPTSPGQMYRHPIPQTPHAAVLTPRPIGPATSTGNSTGNPIPTSPVNGHNTGVNHSATPSIHDGRGMALQPTNFLDDTPPIVNGRGTTLQITNTLGDTSESQEPQERATNSPKSPTHSRRCSQCEATLTEMERLNRDIQAREKRLAITERSLKQREREIEKNLLQMETQKSLIAGLENQVKELTAANRVLQQVADATAHLPRRTPDQYGYNPMTPQAHPQDSTAAEEIRRLREELRHKDLEAKITDKLHSLEYRMTAHISQLQNSGHSRQMFMPYPVAASPHLHYPEATRYAMPTWIHQYPNNMAASQLHQRNVNGMGPRNAHMTGVTHMRPPSGIPTEYRPPAYRTHTAPREQTILQTDGSHNEPATQSHQRNTDFNGIGSTNLQQSSHQEATPARKPAKSPMHVSGYTIHQVNDSPESRGREDKPYTAIENTNSSPKSRWQENLSQLADLAPITACERDRNAPNSPRE